MLKALSPDMSEKRQMELHWQITKTVGSKVKLCTLTFHFLKIKLGPGKQLLFFCDLFTDISWSHFCPPVETLGSTAISWGKLLVKIERILFGNSKNYRIRSAAVFFHFQYHYRVTYHLIGHRKSFKMIPESNLCDAGYSSYIC